MIDFKITSEQIRLIHNGMCYLNRVEQDINEMFKEDSQLVVQFNKAIEYLKPVRDELVKLKDSHHDKIYKECERYREEKRFTQTLWSIYDIESILDKSNVPVGAVIICPNHSIETSQVKGPRWIDLWDCGEEIARNTQGFGDHCFIENFRKHEKLENCYVLELGS